MILVVTNVIWFFDLLLFTRRLVHCLSPTFAKLFSGKSGKSTSGYVDSYGMIDDYTGNLHDSSKSRKGASKSNKDGGKSSKGKSSKESGSNENYYDEGHGRLVCCCSVGSIEVAW